jgi:hypothetical protein
MNNNTVTISCVINTTDVTCPLGIEIWIDDQQILDCVHVTDTINFEHELDDADGTHELKFVMKGKTIDHTQLDSRGEIIKDARLNIQDVSFDEIALGQILIDQAVYTHDFNGSGTPTQDKFYYDMGCNGTLSLKFTTPIYIWLLEHM